ncbi:MAG TPA: 3-hydroxyisobutyrate dehydrogenase [Methylocystis sp.]|nr:3-hydroxyisobutyrate dehydrogenase [Methylocystis sp.]
MSRIAFIGLGAMGGPMAGNLVTAGHDVIGFDLAPALCVQAKKNGVEIAASARDAAGEAQVVITMLPAGDAVLSVWTELLPRVSEGTLFIDCSTIDIASAREAHRLASVAGQASVDAPVSGGVAGAKTASLTFMCGGEAAAVAAARPILSGMGKAIIHCGDPGLGQAAKICNNMMLGANMIVTCEAFALGEKLGLSPQALFNAASVSSGQSWSLTSYCPAPGLVPSSPANSDYKPGFMASLMLKDLKLAQEAAAAAGVATPLGALSAQLYALYNDAGAGGTDFSGIINMIRGKPDARE